MGINLVSTAILKLSKHSGIEIINSKMSDYSGWIEGKLVKTHNEKFLVTYIVGKTLVTSKIFDHFNFVKITVFKNEKEFSVYFHPYGIFNKKLKGILNLRKLQKFVIQNNGLDGEDMFDLAQKRDTIKVVAKLMGMRLYLRGKLSN